MFFKGIKTHKRSIAAFLAVLLLFTYGIGQPQLYETVFAYTGSVGTDVPLKGHRLSKTKITVVKKLSDISANISRLSSKYDTELESARLIVKSKAAVSEFTELGAAEIITAPEGIYIIQFYDGETASAALKIIKASKLTVYAEADRYIEAEAEPEAGCATDTQADPAEPATPTEPQPQKHEYLSWGAEYMGIDKYSEYLINKGCDTEVTVAVIDSGIDLEHEFFKDKIKKAGHDYIDNDQTPDDLTGHGSHTCGIIADLTYNLPNIKIYPIKVFSKYNTALSSSIGYAIQEAADQGADVINLSISCAPSDFINSCITYAIKQGSLVVFAAGNDSYICQKCPSDIADETDGILMVSSINSNGEISDFSNFGNVIDVAAPGGSINSVALGGGYTYKTGTSMSAPHISAAAAMLKSEYPKAIPKQLEIMIKAFSVDAGEIGFDESYGYGITQLDAATNCRIRSTNSAYGSTVYKVKDGEATLIRTSTTSKAYRVSAYFEEYPVTAIAETAFKYCPSLKEITVPDTVTYIAPKTFSVCRLLEKINVSPTSVSFADIDGVLYSKDLTELIAYPRSKQDTSFVIRDSVTALEYGAFNGCGNLQSITVGKALREVSESPFFECDGLKAIYTDPENQYYTSVNGVLYGKSLNNIIKCPPAAGITRITLPETVEKISSDAFSGCTKLTELNTGKALTYIGTRAMRECTALSSVTLNEGLKIIDKMAFYNCSALTELELPLSVEALGACSFAECTSLKSAALNSGLNTVKSSVYSGCTSLTDVLIDTACRNLSYRLFYNCTALKNLKITDKVVALGNYMFYKCTALTSVTLPQDITFIPAACFSSCTALRSIDMGDNVRTISSNAFLGCTALRSADLPQTLKSIGNKAFSSCISLAAIILPDSVEVLEKQAFYKCTGLKIFASYGSPPAISDTLFDSCTSLEYVFLSPSVPYIDQSAFDNCKSLISVNVGYGNTHYTTVSGALINRDTGTLMLYPPKKSSLRFNVPEYVVSIADRAFCNNSALSVLTLPDSVQNIGTDCFLNTSAVTSLTVGRLVGRYTLAQLLPSSVSKLETVNITAEIAELSESTFAGCSSLKSVTLPQRLKTISSGTFSGCTSLETVNIPDGVSFIAEKAFFNCEKLAYVNVPKSLTAIAPYTFYGCKSLKETVIPETVKEIGEYAYSGCKALKSLTVPDSVVKIGQYAFSSCEGLSEIKLSENITELEAGLFYCCYSLTDISLPEGIDRIGDRSFLNCIRLNGITVPDGVTVIEPSTFYGCVSLNTVYLPNSVTAINNRAFFNCKTLNNIKLPENLTTVEDKAFERCAALDDITLPPCTAKLGASAFSGCTKLGGIYIPDAVTEINDETFKDCSSLAYIEGGNGLLTVGKLAFSGCKSLGDTKLSDSITFIAPNAFNDCDSVNLICTPDSYIHTYAAENGVNYTVIFEGDGYKASIPCESDVFTYFNMDKSVNGSTTLYKISAGNGAQVIRRGAKADISIPVATDTDAQLYVITGTDSEIESSQALEYDIENGLYNFTLDCFDEVSVRGGIIGDVNLDGIYDINDLYYMLDLTAQPCGPVSAQERIADINRDGRYDLLDAYAMLIQNNA